MTDRWHRPAMVEFLVQRDEDGFFEADLGSFRHALQLIADLRGIRKCPHRRSAAEYTSW